MSDLAANIANDLLQLKGKSADRQTHALKMLGGGEEGSMIDGVLQIISVMDDDKQLCVKEAKRNYFIGGALAGIILIGLIGGGVWFYSKRQKNKRHDEECKKIKETLDNEVKLSGEEMAVSAPENND